MDGKPHLGDKFQQYKGKVTNLTRVLTKYYNNLMKEIMSGLPNCPEDKGTDDVDYTFDGTNLGTTWKCLSCQSVNDQKRCPEKCGVCGREKPKMTFNAIGSK